MKQLVLLLIVTFVSGTGEVWSADQKLTVEVTLAQGVTTEEQPCQVVLAEALAKAVAQNVVSKIKFTDPVQPFNPQKLMSMTFRGFLKSHKILQPCTEQTTPASISVETLITDAVVAHDLDKVLIKNKVLLVSTESIGDNIPSPSILMGYINPWMKKHGMLLTAITADVTEQEILSLKKRAVEGDPYAAMSLGLRARAAKVIFGSGQAKQHQDVTEKIVASVLELKLWAVDVATGKLLTSFDSTLVPTKGYGADLQEAAFNAYKKGIEPVTLEFLPKLK